MTHAIIATGRIVTPYTLNGLTHVHHCYVRNPQSVGGVWQINSRTLDENDTLFSDACEGLAHCIGGVAPSTLTWGQQLLQTLSGGVWTTVATHQTSMGVTNQAYKPATEITVVLRDKLLNRFKFVLLEQCEAAPQHFVDPTAGDVYFDALLVDITSKPSTPVTPWVWMVSKYNQYLITDPVVGVTVTVNRKVRRARGLT